MDMCENLKIMRMVDQYIVMGGKFENFVICGWRFSKILGVVVVDEKFKNLAICDGKFSNVFVLLVES